ncbi:TetR/AcrR family transcriptional regulator [Pyxidicoccus parkwayensis]|uniref:TetR/AcrR family transcriptional regulator n=1 Tax=Pyxidicoccus parkwayensis TaxID=2813578 RepID=A0ABX7NR96_9BACT|nr:TetR/AcrR family transcriptional regulator [Pyxidicoccus parkwaysis]QSQ21392.1 TetR/AcrR family transcriptional regulator [Pyxidicoccus parkwaysis]
MSREKRAEKPAGGLWGKTPASRQRRQEILIAAKDVFLEDGYQVASMERLAEAAGTTKRTLYDHFGNKEGLFAASIEYGSELFVGRLPRVEDLSADTAEAIPYFIDRMAAVMNAPDAIRFQRLVIAEAERHPEFGRILNEAAFVAAEHVLRDYLKRQVEAGRLKAHDVAAWAKTLVSLTKNHEHTQALLGLPAGRDTHAEHARNQLIGLYVDAHRRDGAG